MYRISVDHVGKWLACLTATEASATVHMYENEEAARAASAHALRATRVSTQAIEAVCTATPLGSISKPIRSWQRLDRQDLISKAIKMPAQPQSDRAAGKRKQSWWQQANKKAKQGAYTGKPLPAMGAAAVIGGSLSSPDGDEMWQVWLRAGSITMLPAAAIDAMLRSTGSTQQEETRAEYSETYHATQEVP